MTTRFADLIVGLVAGCMMALVLCGTGHASLTREESLVVERTKVSCYDDMESLMREQEAVAELEKRVKTFYRGERDWATTSVDTNSLQFTEMAYVLPYHVCDDGRTLCVDEAPLSDYHPPVKKTEQEIYEERKAQILKRLEDLDTEREQKWWSGIQEASYRLLQDDLEEARGALIVHWASVKRACWRERP